MANLNDLIKNTDNLLKAIDNERKQSTHNEENIKKTVDAALAKIDELLATTEELSYALGITDCISDKTNLLATQAAIEASKDIIDKENAITEESNIIKFPR